MAVICHLVLNLAKKKMSGGVFFWSGVVLLAVSRNVKFVIQENPTLSFGNSSVKLSISTFSSPQFILYCSGTVAEWKDPQNCWQQKLFCPQTYIVLLRFICFCKAFGELPSWESQPKTAFSSRNWKKIL